MSSPCQQPPASTSSLPLAAPVAQQVGDTEFVYLSDEQMPIADAVPFNTSLMQSQQPDEDLKAAFRQWCLQRRFVLQPSPPDQQQTPFAPLLAAFERLQKRQRLSRMTAPSLPWRRR